MPDEYDKHGKETDEADEADEAEVDSENERPTVSPPFDPIAFARDVSSPSSDRTLAPDAHTRATPPQGTEHATRSGRAPYASGTPSRRTTPTTTLSLANACIPSQLPPAAFGKLDTHRHASLSPPPIDREWADLDTVPQRPPEDDRFEPILEQAHDSAPQLELLEVGFEDEHAADTVRKPLPIDAFERVTPEARDGEMRDRVSLGDYSGALEIAEKILADDPAHEEAEACAESCRTVLRQLYATRIGPLDRVPVVMVPRDQLRWLSIDHKAGFVLSLVDGVSNLEMIIDVSGMPELDTLRILSDLAQQRIISLR